jgi:hypothetical protein
MKVKRLAMPQKEETAKYKTKIENTDCTLHCDVHHCQRYPVNMLKYKDLKEKNIPFIS